MQQITKGTICLKDLECYASTSSVAAKRVGFSFAVSIARSWNAKTAGLKCNKNIAVIAAQRHWFSCCFYRKVMERKDCWVEMQQKHRCNCSATALVFLLFLSQGHGRRLRLAWRCRSYPAHVFRISISLHLPLAALNSGSFSKRSSPCNGVGI